MKKLKLFFSALALILFGGQLWATNWVGNEVANGEFYLYNVGAKKYLSFGENWGSIATADHAGIPVTLTAGNGTYTIVTNVTEDGKGLFFDGGATYTDGTPANWTFKDVNVDGKNVYTLKCGDAYLYWSGNEPSQVLSTATDISEVDVENTQWQLVTKDERDAAFIGNNASETDPLDITYKYIENPNTTWFTHVYTTTNPWTKGGDKGWDLKDGNGGWWDGKDKTYEVYNGNFDNYIEITDVPNGIYEFGVQGFYRDGGYEDAIAHFHNGTFVENAKIYANSNTTSLQSIGVSEQTSEIYQGNDKSAAVSGTTYYVPNSPLGGSLYFIRGKYPWQTVRTVVTDGKLRFGVKKETTIGGDWTLVDKFFLSYLGEPLSIYENLYTEALTSAQEAWNLRKTTYVNVTGTEKTALENAVTTYATCENNKDAYIAATNALNAATEAFVGAKDSYDSFVFEKTHAATLGVTEFPTPTIAAEALEGVNTLKVAEHNAVVSKYTTDGSALFIPSWDKDNFDAMSNEHWSGGTSEYFDKNGSNFTSRIYKEVTLPEGHYVFYAAARGHVASTATLKVTIGNEIKSIPVNVKGNRGRGINTSGAADFSANGTYACNGEGYGWEWRHIAFDLNEESTVTLAIECGAGSNWAWVSAGDTRLVTYDNIAVSKNRYEAALAAANAALQNQDYINVTGQEKDALDNAIPQTEPTTKDEYDAAATALEDALSAFTAAAPSYDAYVAYKNETIALFGSDLNVAIPTSASECETAIHNLNIAQYNTVKSGYPYSLSGLIGDFGSWTGTATVNNDPAEPRYLTTEHWSGEPHAYYEQAGNGWNSDAWTVQFTKTCKLPAGSYVLKVAARASENVTGTLTVSGTNISVPLPNVGAFAKGIDKDGNASWTGDNFARDDNTGFGWQWRFLPFTLENEQEVTMVVSGKANKKENWMSIADGELLSANDVATPVAYDEEATNTITDVPIANVTMTRNIKADYNTVVLPFTLTANQVAAAFGTGTEVYIYSESSESANNVTINFTKNDGSISANVPVLLKATIASTSQTFEGVQVVASTDAKVEGTNFDFVGTYAPITVAEGDYFVGNGALYKSTGATSMNAFRAYIHNKSNSEVRFVIDGQETNGIEGLEVINTKNNGKIYNLNGQEVKGANKGLYIQNGKKYVVK